DRKDPGRDGLSDRALARAMAPRGPCAGPHGRWRPRRGSRHWRLHHSRSPAMNPPLVAAAPLAAALAAPVRADTFLIHQTGYADGARVTGWFQGEDADHDGWIFPFETTNFLLSFSGNSIVGAFTHSMANGGAGGVTYQLGSGEFT